MRYRFEKIRAFMPSVICGIGEDDPGDPAGGGEPTPSDPSAEPGEPAGEPAAAVETLTRDQHDAIVAAAVAEATAKTEANARRRYQRVANKNPKGKGKAAKPAPKAPAAPAGDPETDDLPIEFDRQEDVGKLDRMLRRMGASASSDAAFEEMVDWYRFSRDKYTSVDAFGQHLQETKMFLKAETQTPAAAPTATTAQAPAAANGTPHPMPRRVQDLSGNSGLVDVFDLSEDEVNSMTLKELAGHYEKAKAAFNQSKGAPPIPDVLSRRAK